LNYIKNIKKENFYYNILFKGLKTILLLPILKNVALLKRPLFSNFYDNTKICLNTLILIINIEIIKSNDFIKINKTRLSIEK
jgi:hypothetical protein